MIRYRRSAQRGFTLMELMVVIAIIGLLSAFLFSVSGRSVGANARSVSEQITGQINFAKLRAQSTRRIHKITIQPNRLTIAEGATTGLAMPSSFATVQTSTLPGGVRIADVVAGATTTTGATVEADPSLAYDLFVRPDGQATGSTLYITDGRQQWRVIVYTITGGTYARPSW